MKKPLIYKTEGCFIDEVEFELTKEIKRNIKKAITILKNNKWIDNITLFDYMDMDMFIENEKLERMDTFNFRYDYVKYLVNEGSTYIRVYNKWVSSEYFEVELINSEL